MAADEVWRLYRGGELIGEIVIDGADFPWLEGRFVPRPGFERFRPWFDQEFALLESIEEDIDGWESVYHRIAETLTLVGPDGPVAECLLHIQDDRAWFRWSDEPFDEA